MGTWPNCETWNFSLLDLPELVPEVSGQAVLVLKASPRGMHTARVTHAQLVATRVVLLVLPEVAATEVEVWIRGQTKGILGQTTGYKYGEWLEAIQVETTVYTGRLGET